MLNAGLRMCGAGKHRGSSAVFSFFKTVRVDHTKVPADQTNFPMLVSGTFAYLKDTAHSGDVQSSSGFDIVFSNDMAGLTRLPFEIESYDPTTGTVNFWVKLPTVSSTVDTIFYMVYGCATISASQENVAVTWSNGFTSVMHMNGSSADTSGNGNNGSDTAMSYTSALIAEGASFNGSTSGIGQGGGSTLGEGAALTVSAWVNFSTLPNSYNTVEAKSEPSGNAGRSLLIRSDGKLTAYVKTTAGTGGQYVPYDGTGSHTLSSGTWYYLAYTFDGSGSTTLVGYVNGAVDATVGGTGASSVGPLGANSAVESWGHDPPFDPKFFGTLMDEARIASVARSANWLLTEYNNQGSPGTFFSVVDTTLMHRWVFTEGTGATAADSSFYADSDLTLSGETWVTSSIGVLTNAVTFAGGGGAVSANNNRINFGNTDPFSLSIWFETSNASTEMTLIGNLDPSTNFIGWEINLNGFGNSGGINFINIASYSTDWIGQHSAFSANTLYNLVVTYDGSGATGGLKIYLNGTLQSSSQIALSSSSLSATTASGKDLYIAERSDGTNKYTGTVGPTYIWNRVLLATEVASLYSRPYAPPA